MGGANSSTVVWRKVLGAMVKVVGASKTDRLYQVIPRADYGVRGSRRGGANSRMVVWLRCWLLHLGLVIGCSRGRSPDDVVISRTPPVAQNGRKSYKSGKTW